MQGPRDTVSTPGECREGRPVSDFQQPRSRERHDQPEEYLRDSHSGRVNRPTADELYCNLELLISHYSAEGLDSAKARLTSIAMMVHEMRACERSIRRAQKEISANHKYLDRYHKNGKATRDKWTYLRLNKAIASSTTIIKAYQAYMVRAKEVVDSRLEKLPELTNMPALRKRPDMKYMRAAFVRCYQKRKFSFNFADFVS